MIAVIFEVWPAEGEQDTYLALAAKLKAELAQVDGFISVERFESLAEPGKLLSLSFFRNGAAIKSWRNHPAHRTTQTRGRAGVFRDYRLRIAVVTRDYGLKDRMEAPSDSQSAHPTTKNNS